MKLCFLSASLLSLVSAFSTLPSSPSFKNPVGSNVVLSAEGSASVSAFEQKKPMSPKEILAQQREKAGLPDPDKHPKLYSDELLDDMKEILLLLEKRVQGGQGSISATEVQSFVTMSNNILVEMKEKEYERLKDAKTSSPESPPTPEPSVGASDVSTATTTTDSADLTTLPEAADDVYSETEEGPGYSPAGGQGSMPKDTTNTYIIPGMDAMSPEEYRVALQKSISDRQAQRKATGTYGNRNTWDYLNNLSGDTGVLKKDELEN